MARMRAVDAIVQILEKEGAAQTFGVPGAAINPLYSAMEKHGGIRHVLARHPEAASHMAEGYTRTKPGNVGVAIATSGPGGTDLITGMYSSGADSTSLLCITGQVATPVLHKEEFQGVDIASIAKPVTKYAETVLEAAQVPGAMAKAFQAVRSGRPGSALVDLPTDVQLTEIEFDIDAYEPLPLDKPVMSRYQADKILDMLEAAEHPILVAGGGVISSGSTDLFVEFAEYVGVPVISTLMGWGTIPDDHHLAQGMAGIQTSQRYANATLLASDLVIGIGNRWAARATGALDVFREGRKFVHVDIDATQIGRVFPPDFWSVSDAGEALKVLIEAAKERYSEPVKKYDEWVSECNARRCSPDMLRKTNFDNVPLKPQRVYQAMNEAFGKDTRYVTTIGLSQIAAAQFLHVYHPNHWINAGQAGPLGWTMPAALGVVTADPNTPVVALSGDYDFGFLIEELAVGAQHEIPYVHVLVHNAYLGLIRQGQRAFGIDYQLQLSFKNQSSDTDGYGVDHVKVAEGMGCKGIRVRDPEMLVPAMKEAQQIAKTFRVPVVVECILERVTNISMGTALNNLTEFEEMAVDPKVDAPTAICFQLKK